MKTAVEWFELELKDKLGQIVINQNWKLLEEIIQQAKEMEKEQIIESYCNGCADIIKDENIFPRETSEQYYNETFKSE